VQNDLTKNALEETVNEGVGAVRRTRVQQQVELLWFRGCHCFEKEVEGRRRVTAARH